MSKLSATNLRKKYKSRTVVKDVSFDVGSGEVVGLLGPNGAGKTTCFYMVVGLVAALAGGRLLRGLVFGVGSSDPTILALVTAFLVTVALAAMYLPARRASRSDPMIALRTD